MPGKDVRKKRASKHDERPGEETGRGAESPLFHPKEHERANGKDMERHCPVDRSRQWQNQKEPIRRIEQRPLHPPEIGCPAEDMRIPQRQISLCQFSEAEFAPREIL